MKFLTLSILALLREIHADVSHIDMVADDRPMTAMSLLPERTTCCVSEPTDSLDRFEERVKLGELKGPCYYRMRRTYTGNVTDYLSKTGQSLDDPNIEFLTFLVKIQAPKAVQTYINTIHFEQQHPGSHCTSFRISRRPTDEGESLGSQSKAEVEEQPRYFRRSFSYDEKTPRWTIGGYQQLNGDDYLLEVPRGCLTDPSNLVIKTTHVFEDAAGQAETVDGQGAFVGVSEACSVNETMAEIDTHEEYLTLIRTLPRKCGYAFKRAYAWHVPESKILVKAGKTTVIAQIALNEPMLTDHGRRVTRLSLGTLVGATCAETAVYARRKGVDEELQTRVKNVTLGDDGVYVESPWYFSDPVYDFRFVLPSGCTIEKSTVTVRVVDSKEEDESGGVEDSETEDATTETSEDTSTTDLPFQADQLRSEKWPIMHFPEVPDRVVYWNGTDFRYFNLRGR